MFFSTEHLRPEKCAQYIIRYPDTHYGHADAENDTIVLNDDFMRDEDSILEDLAFATSTATRESYLIDSTIGNNNFAGAWAREWTAMGVQSDMIADLKENLGIDLMASDEYGDISEAIADAYENKDLSSFNWMGGDDLFYNMDGTVTIEKGDSLSLLAKEINDIMGDTAENWSEADMEMLDQILGVNPDYEQNPGVVKEGEIIDMPYVETDDPILQAMFGDKDSVIDEVTSAKKSEDGGFGNAIKRILGLTDEKEGPFINTDIGVVEFDKTEEGDDNLNLGDGERYSSGYDYAVKEVNGEYYVFFEGSMWENKKNIFKDEGLGPVCNMDVAMRYPNVIPLYKAKNEDGTGGVEYLNANDQNEYLHDLADNYDSVEYTDDMDYGTEAYEQGAAVIYNWKNPNSSSPGHTVSQTDSGSGMDEDEVWHENVTEGYSTYYDDYTPILVGESGDIKNSVIDDTGASLIQVDQHFQSSTRRDNVDIFIIWPVEDDVPWYYPYESEDDYILNCPNVSCYP